MKATANQTRNGRHALQEDGSSDIVITEVQITTEKQHVNNSLRYFVTHTNSCALRLLAPTLL